jgi:hypothetical protein
MKMMNEKRIGYLLSFMEALNASQSTNHNVNREINIVTKELMHELGLNDPDYLKEQKRYEEYISIIKEMVGENKYRFNYLINIIYYTVRDSLYHRSTIFDSHDLNVIRLPYIRQSGATTNSIAICKLHGPNTCHFVVAHEHQKRQLSKQHSDIDVLIPLELKYRNFNFDISDHIFILEDTVTIESVVDYIPSKYARYTTIIQLIGV